MIEEKERNERMEWRYELQTIEDNTTIMNQGSNEEHILPLLSCLKRDGESVRQKGKEIRRDRQTVEKCMCLCYNEWKIKIKEWQNDGGLIHTLLNGWSCNRKSEHNPSDSSCWRRRNQNCFHLNWAAVCVICTPHSVCWNLHQSKWVLLYWGGSSVKQ